MKKGMAKIAGIDILNFNKSVNSSTNNPNVSNQNKSEPK